jgi:hypothetical protein
VYQGIQTAVARAGPGLSEQLGAWRRPKSKMFTPVPLLEL